MPPLPGPTPHASSPPRSNRTAARDPAIMPLGDHLEELRRRIWWALVGIFPIFLAGLYFGKPILDVMVGPLIRALSTEGVGGGMQTTSVLEGFMNYLKIAAILAVIVGGPWIVYQLWKFVAPGLYQRERRFFYLLAPLSVLLTGAGVVFMYMVMLPFVLFFFVHFNEGLITRAPSPVVDVPAGITLPAVPHLAGDPASPAPGQMWLNTERSALRIAAPGAGAPADPAAVKILSLPLQSDSFVVQHYKINEYVNLVLGFALAFAIAFQTPVVVLLLGWAGVFSLETLRRQRKYALLVCTIIAAIVTPPDAISMLSLMLPMYLLFEVGLLLLAIMPAERVARGLFKPDAPETEPAP